MRKAIPRKRRGTAARANAGEPLAEDHRGGCKRLFTKGEIASIIQQRDAMIAKGMNDWAIANEIASGTGRDPYTLNTKIHQLIKDQVLERNPNRFRRRHFSDEEKAFIGQERGKLIAEGKQDRTIAWAIGKRLGRAGGSVEAKIRDMVTASELEPNPNKIEMSRLSAKERDVLLDMREALSSKGMNDKGIAAEVAKRIGAKPHSISYQIRCLIREGKLEENPNKTRRRAFSPKDVSLLMRQRASLMAEGLTDNAIAERLADAFTRTVGTMKGKLRQLVHGGRMQANPNSQSRQDITQEEVALIAERRSELLSQGMTDWRIAHVLEGETDRTAGTLYGKIKQMVEAGTAPRNGNAEGRPSGFFKTLEDDELISYAKEFLDENGLKTRKELGDFDKSLYAVLLKRGLMDSVGLGRRMHLTKMSDEQLLKMAQERIKKEGASTRSGFRKSNWYLHKLLYERALLEKVGFREDISDDTVPLDKSGKRSWARASDNAVIGYAKRLIRENSITTMQQLAEMDQCLYIVLRKRKLQGKVGIKFSVHEKRWSARDNDWIIRYARGVISRKGIQGKSDLRRTHKSLYDVLIRRNLLDIVLRDADRDMERQGVREVVKALSEFGGHA